MPLLHGPGYSFTKIDAFGKDFFERKVFNGMARGTCSENKRIELVFPDFKDDLLTGFVAAKKGMMAAKPDSRNLICQGSKFIRVDRIPDLASAADIYPYVF
jgi:hypothetical protein